MMHREGTMPEVNTSSLVVVSLSLWQLLAKIRFHDTVVEHSMPRRGPVRATKYLFRLPCRHIGESQSHFSSPSLFHVIFRNSSD